MYYRAWDGDRSYLCALDSSDGLNWERPELGLVEFDGSTRNNITNAPADHLTIICDPPRTGRRPPLENDRQQALRRRRGRQ